MKLHIEKGQLEEQKADLLIVNAFKDDMSFGGATGSVNAAYDGILETIAKSDGFDGTKAKTLLVHTPSGPAKRLLLIGLGEKKAFNEQVIREVSATAYKVAKSLKVKRVVSILHGAGSGGLSPKRCGLTQGEGVLLAHYEFTKHKKQEKKKESVSSWTIVTNDGSHARYAKQGLELAELTSEGIRLARDLVNEPAQNMVPADMARVAKQIAKESGGLIAAKVLTLAQIKKEKMGGLLGVGQGSDNPPHFIHLQYKPAKAKKRVALVGKGVTFDSGGYSLKPGQYMETMKCDMGGAAAVFGVFSILARLKPKVQVDGIVGAAENMVSGNAIRPGDVLKARNGKTMEVLNTDAEGRLTLADSLSYASELKPNYIIDLATLTGACVVALGEEIIGLMGNNDALKSKLLESAEEAGEHMWALPLQKSYRKLLDSKVADVKNIGGRYGGAITAGLFLQEFVDPDIAWAHLDIAGPAFAERQINAYTQYGGTGAGVGTLISFLSRA